MYCFWQIAYLEVFEISAIPATSIRLCSLYVIHTYFTANYGTPTNMKNWHSHSVVWRKKWRTEDQRHMLRRQYTTTLSKTFLDSIIVDSMTAMNAFAIFWTRLERNWEKQWQTVLHWRQLIRYLEVIWPQSTFAKSVISTIIFSNLVSIFRFRCFSKLRWSTWKVKAVHRIQNSSL